MKKIFLIVFLTLLTFLVVGCAQNIKLVNGENKYNQNDESFTIVFENNDGNIISNQILKFNDEIIEPKNIKKDDSARYHYAFIGWDINGDGEKDEIPKVASSSIVARALYSYSLNSYNVEFDVGCESYQGALSQEIKYGESATPPTQLVKQGYTFEGWDTAYDYIVGNTVIKAIWETEKFNVILHGDSLISVDNKQEIQVPAHYGYYESLSVPNKTTKQFVFFGWKNKDGELLTNPFGDLFKPLEITEDLDLYISYELVVTGKTYELGRMTYNEVTDASLHSEIKDFAERNSVESGYFYFNNNYYNIKNYKVYNAKIVDYYAVCLDSFSGMVWDMAYAPCVFITKDILYSAKPDEVSTVINQYKTDVELYRSMTLKVSLPYSVIQQTYIAYPTEPTMEELEDFLYVKSTQSYKTDVSTETEVLDTANISKDNYNFLVSKSNLNYDTPIFYTNKLGIKGELDANEIYGVRIMVSLRLTTNV